MDPKGPVGQQQPDAATAADRARQVASQIKPSARSKEILDLLYPTTGPQPRSVAAAAVATQLQQKRMEPSAATNAGAAALKHDPGAPAATAAAPLGADLPDSSGSSSATTTQQPKPSTPQESKQAAIAADLASASTSAGPIIMTTPEASAEAQQALSLLNSYDFKIYGQGLMAGSQAVPLAPPDEKVLYKPPPIEQTPPLPTPENTPPTPPPPPAAAAAAAPGTIAMQPLPEPSSSSSSKLLRPEATVIKPFGPAGGAEESNVTYPALREQQQQQRHVKAPASASAAARGSVTSDSLIRDGLREEGLRKRVVGQQYTSTGQQYRQYGQGSTFAGRGGTVAGGGGTVGRSRAARVKGWMQQKWNVFKEVAVEKIEDAAAWLLHMLWLLLVWVGRLLLTPLTGVFGPWYRYNRHLKVESCKLLHNQVDLDQLQQALGALPSWLQGVGGSTEKMMWLNSLLAQVWPIMDPVVCALIRSSIEPLLDDMKPPFIAAMGFQKLTLGELPIELEGIRVVGDDKQGHTVSQPGQSPPENVAVLRKEGREDDRLELEVDFHWVGEPNISFFVELALAGPYTRLVPRVSNLTSRGTLRLGLTRLVPELPGFGALLVSLAREPQIKFTLDFGPALGGKFTAKPVAAFLDPFLRDTLATMIVWPNRFVVPLLPREATGNLDDLALHSRGVLEIEVLKAHHLPKKGGTLSTVDPQVELWTQPQHRVYSKVKKGTRNPNWKGQVLEVLVQEPDSQQLRVVLNDIDMLNIKELLQVNLLKGAAGLVRSAHPIGRAALPLYHICDKPYERQEVELKLSSSEWAYELGIVDEGDSSSLQLALTYRPFQELRAYSTAPINCKGVLIIDVRQCQDLAAADWNAGSSDPYVLLKVAGQQQQTAVLPHNTSPTFNSHHEFFNVQVPDVLQVQVWDRDYLKPDDMIGYVELPVKTIITWTQGGGRGWRDGWWRLRKKASMFGNGKNHDSNAGRIEMKVQYRPYTTST